MATNDDHPNGVEEWQGHPLCICKDSAASSLPGSRQTTIAHPGGVVVPPPSLRDSFGRSGRKNSSADLTGCRAEERQGHPSAPKDSAASSLPGRRQTTIAHPGRSRRAATLSPGLVWRKKSSVDVTGVQGRATESNTDDGHRGARSFDGSMHSEQQMARLVGVVKGYKSSFRLPTTSLSLRAQQSRLDPTLKFLPLMVSAKNDLGVVM
ncbi:hypothetical protein CEXT_174511 [Caerostris extrusa]|uniref:Uncharacterized protein n=1 Tax=Caerostris extrusa TaxID=172846 RepID=A0AAV4XEJ8_CAEEX|nr:hypothetical protein CEXT_174511 [Caerostris extrusa]